MIFLYAPARLVQGLPNLSFSSRADLDASMERMARGYYLIAERAGKRFAYVYLMDSFATFKSKIRKTGKDASQWYQDYLDAVLRYFPAVSFFADVPGSEDGLITDEIISARAKAKHRAFIQDAMSEYYMSKVTRDGSIVTFGDKQKDIFAGADHAKLSRYYIPSRGSFALREKLQNMVKNDSPMLNLVTWNDYPEGHHLAPEINHNFAFSLLLQYYKKIWQTGTASVRDEIALFYKKYPTTAVPSPFNMRFVPPRWIVSEADWKALQKEEDIIEVVTIASSPATLAVNGKERGTVPAGIFATRIPMEIGPVQAELARNGKIIRNLKGTEWITDKPYRADRITYAYSTICDATYRKLFGKPMESSHEYAEENGVPYWKKAYSLK